MLNAYTNWIFSDGLTFHDLNSQAFTCFSLQAAANIKI